ncbi:hypothetical protein [Polynucleobacter sinensis]|uniref:hypothetical protein n=1 Tax=Polynucleobacter sinensis TaxID=1743157 RepID=UPI00078570DD|nr:hypothetical protein [Polynucleobacter sinensis]
MPRLDRRLELLEIRHKRLFQKPALIKFYAVGEKPTEEDLIESRQAQAIGRLVISFFAKQMGIEDDSIKRTKKPRKKK